ncbi:MAG: hypothetical protein WDM94_09090 [Bauldia sp.]
MTRSSAAFCAGVSVSLSAYELTKLARMISGASGSSFAGISAGARMSGLASAGCGG